MEKKELICIGCPLGCLLTVTMEAGELLVTGNTCRRGEAYAQKEILHPARIVTSTVPVSQSPCKRISVKTERDVPKEKIFAVMEEIRTIQATAPVQIGDVLLDDCAGTGVAVVATKAAPIL